MIRTTRWITCALFSFSLCVMSHDQEPEIVFANLTESTNITAMRSEYGQSTASQSLRDGEEHCFNLLMAGNSYMNWHNYTEAGDNFQSAAICFANVGLNDTAKLVWPDAANAYEAAAAAEKLREEYVLAAIKLEKAASAYEYAGDMKAFEQRQNDVIEAYGAAVKKAIDKKSYFDAAHIYYSMAEYETRRGNNQAARVKYREAAKTVMLAADSFTAKGEHQEASSSYEGAAYCYSRAGSDEDKSNLAMAKAKAIESKKAYEIQKAAQAELAAQYESATRSKRTSEEEQPDVTKIED